ncbi:YciI family protein [Paenarthrobacter sp. NPDC089675]|uniref:YciI family protein n=1 Tax=Paenarthrobacter sp. NPDC089675 TaxID=3364376 RepID=UPI003816507B
MTKYLISFPGEAMMIPEGEFQAVADAAHAVIEEAKQAGVYVFGGGINEDVAPVRVSGDGAIQPGTYPGHTVPNGGYTVLELPSREAAIEWASKIAVACRCPQELREFQYDPAS